MSKPLKKGGTRYLKMPAADFFSLRRCTNAGIDKGMRTRIHRKVLVHVSTVQDLVDMGKKNLLLLKHVRTAITDAVIQVLASRGIKVPKEPKQLK